jgi:RpiB/LacA/LacB family sugar-phosphate isomerase
VRDDQAGGDAAALVPVADVRRVAVGCDHTGVELKRHLAGHLRGRGLTVIEFGAEDKTPVDYPDVAASVGRAVARGEVDAGIVIDGAGLGSTMAANKIRGVRAALCLTETLARYAREHNGANVLALGAMLLAPGDAVRIVETWLATPMTEPRYIRRLVKIAQLESARREPPMTPADLQRLVEIIVDELSAASGRARSGAVRLPLAALRLLPRPPARGARRGRGAPRPARLGRAHGRRGQPDRSHAAQARRHAPGHRAAVPRGAEFRFATVCVNPTWVALAARLLRDTPVAVCSVVGFPLGATTGDVKHYETRRAIFDGAREIDMVINVGALKSGDLRVVERDIEAVTTPCREAASRAR